MIDWQGILRRYRDRPLFIEGRRITSYGEFHQKLSRQPHAPTNQPLAIAELVWSPQSLGEFLGAVQSGRSVLLDAAMPCRQLEKFPDPGPFLILKSGGTSGEPRHVVHPLMRFLANYKVMDREERRCMILYAAGHLAGLDAFLQAVHRGSSLVIPKGWSADAIGSAIEEAGVGMLAATPSMLQFLLLGGGNDSHDLSSVNLVVHGAEGMPLPLRERLLTAFPNARLQNRYGLTEVGSLPVQADPDDPDALILDSTEHAWKIESGELFVKSPSRCLGTLEEGPLDPGSQWYPTGDMAEFTDTGAVRILGRRESMINVGGIKVTASRVEEMLLSCEAVLDATVFPEPHAFTGHTVAAKVVFRDKQDVAGLLREVRKQSLRQGLPLAFAPTRILAVEELKLTDSLKKQRFPDCHIEYQP